VAVIPCQQLNKLAEALLLLEHVHGQHEAVAPNVSTTQLGVVEDGIQVFQNGVQLKKEGRGRVKKEEERGEAGRRGSRRQVEGGQQQGRSR